VSLKASLALLEVIEKDFSGRTQTTAKKLNKVTYIRNWVRKSTLQNRKQKYCARESGGKFKEILSIEGLYTIKLFGKI